MKLRPPADNALRVMAGRRAQQDGKGGHEPEVRIPEYRDEDRSNRVADQSHHEEQPDRSQRVIPGVFVSHPYDRKGSPKDDQDKREVTQDTE